MGSAVVELDETGSVTERMSYDAWGKRRAPETAEFYAAGFVPVLTNNRGFTGHEHLDDVGLINMNARLYDPELGRFLQADTVTESLTYSQVFNRYTYVGNNPLSHTDPTGHSWLSKLFRKIPILKSILAIAVAIAFQQYQMLAFIGIKSAAVTAAVGGFIAGGISGGTFKSALIGGLTAFAFAKIHGWKEMAADLGDKASGFVKAVATKPGSALAHGMVGGMSSVAQGGKFGSGFLSAGFSDFAGSYVNFEGVNATAKNAVAHAVIGGAVSQATGGKFANGAVTSAFGYLYNSELDRARLRASNARHSIAVAEAMAKYTVDGYTIVHATPVGVLVDGELTLRYYDFIVFDPVANVNIGVEVKTTIGEVIRLNRNQVRKDARLIVHGGSAVRTGLQVNGVGYYTRCFGCELLDVRPKALRAILKAARVPFQHGEQPGQSKP